MKPIVKFNWLTESLQQQTAALSNNSNTQKYSSGEHVAHSAGYSTHTGYWFWNSNLRLNTCRPRHADVSEILPTVNSMANNKWFYFNILLNSPLKMDKLFLLLVLSISCISNDIDLQWASLTIDLFSCVCSCQSCIMAGRTEAGEDGTGSSSQASPRRQVTATPCVQQNR